MNVDKLRLIYDTAISIDDDTVLIMDGDKYRIANTNYGMLKPLDYYAVMGRGLVVMQSDDNPQQLNELDSKYDIYIQGKYIQNITDIEVMLLIKDAIIDLEIYENTRANCIMRIDMKKVNSTFTDVQIRLSNLFKYQTIILNNKGKVVYSFESCIKGAIDYLGDNVIIQINKDSELKERLSKLGRADLKIFNTVQSRSTAILDSDGNIIANYKDIKKCGNSIIIDESKLAKIENNKVKVYRTAEQLGKARIVRLSQGLCLATTENDIGDIVENCCIIDTEDNKLWKDVTVDRRFIYNNTLIIQDSSEVTIIRLNDFKRYIISGQIMFKLRNITSNYDGVTIIMDNEDEYSFNGIQLTKKSSTGDVMVVK